MVEPDVVDLVHHLVHPLLASQGLELVGVEHTGGVLRVTVDRPGGVDLDAIADATRQVSAALDRHDPLPGRYLLEVSSPGLERPLRTPAHFQRVVGTTVSVRTRPGSQGERRVEGVLEAADGDGIVVQGRRLLYDEVERARTVFQWGPAPRPARPRRRKAHAS